MDTLNVARTKLRNAGLCGRLRGLVRARMATTCRLDKLFNHNWPPDRSNYVGGYLTRHSTYPTTLLNFIQCGDLQANCLCICYVACLLDDPSNVTVNGWEDNELGTFAPRPSHRRHRHDPPQGRPGEETEDCPSL